MSEEQIDEYTDLPETDTYFLARLRNRIVNMGVEVLSEEVLIENVHIAHPEDLVFDQGSKGIRNAGNVMSQMGKGNNNNVSIKWDGCPALIFGRDERGRFVLTDKAAFKAKKYDGLATSPEDIQRIMATRKGDRTELVQTYTKLWPLVEATIPDDFRGYMFGDLLYSDTPPVKNNKYVFKPNVVTYEVDANTELGKQVGASEAGIVIHGYFANAGSEPNPVSDPNSKMNDVPQMLMISSTFGANPDVTIDKRSMGRIHAVLDSAREIDKLFHPASLRQQKISNFPGLMKQFINVKVRQGNFDNLTSEFFNWLPASGVNEDQQNRIKQHVAQNKEGFMAVVQSFKAVTAAKQQIIDQLDQQSGPVRASVEGEPGHEGYVATIGDLAVKYVDRMKFSKANFSANNQAKFNK